MDHRAMKERQRMKQEQEARENRAATKVRCLSAQHVVSKYTMNCVNNHLSILKFNLQRAKCPEIEWP